MSKGLQAAFAIAQFEFLLSHREVPRLLARLPHVGQDTYPQTQQPLPWVHSLSPAFACSAARASHVCALSRAFVVAAYTHYRFSPSLVGGVSLLCLCLGALPPSAWASRIAVQSADPTRWSSFTGTCSCAALLGGSVQS